MNDRTLREPKDLGVKIGTKIEAMWTTVKINMENAIEAAENEIIYSKEVLKLAKDKILLEQRK